MTELMASLTGLAGTPDDHPRVDELLRSIAAQVPATVASVHSASITGHPGGALTTPDLLSTGANGFGGSLRFGAQARSLDLYASLSIPLFVGSGAVIASLDLYSRAPGSLAPLSSRVLALYSESSPMSAEIASERLTDGGEHLLDALAAALRIHDDIQHALGVLIATRHRSAAEAYGGLRRVAERDDVTLHEAATGILERRQS